MRILGTGSALPALSVPNTALEAFLDTSDEWIHSRTGIRSRHILTDETLADLATQAALHALKSANVAGSELDLILGTTARGDQVTPAIACMVQKAVGATCPCMDVNAACTGFLYGLDAAQAYLQSGKAKKILLISAEGMSRLCDWTDRATSVLFGDGAGAVVLSNEDGLLSMLLTATQDLDILYIQPPAGNSPFAKAGEAKAGVHMSGQEVFRFAVSHAVEDILAVTEKAGVPLHQVDWFLLHQANHRILEAVRQRLDLPKEKFPFNIHRVGNTSSASIPILLDELHRQGSLKENGVIVFSAFGAGLSTGACTIRWKPNTTNI